MVVSSTNKSIFHTLKTDFCYFLYIHIIMPPPAPTYEEVLARKTLPPEQLVVEYDKLKRYKPTNLKRTFAGNPILYHFQLDNLCRVKVAGHSFYEIMNDETLRNDLWEKTLKYGARSRPETPDTRMFEMWRRLKGAVVFFRPTIAINVYKQFNPTHILDVCMGWGGRMLGAMVHDIDYTGIDTNIDLKPAYENILATFPTKSNITLLWENSLSVDFSTIPYDLVLTSPPYYNTELYPHMTPYQSKPLFYKEFLIPLIDKCRQHIRNNGKVCFNISPKMYADLLKYGYDPAEDEIPMLQQKIQGIDKKDQIYVWSKL